MIESPSPGMGGGGVGKGGRGGGGDCSTANLSKDPLVLVQESCSVETIAVVQGTAFSSVRNSGNYRQIRPETHLPTRCISPPAILVAYWTNGLSKKQSGTCSG